MKPSLTSAAAALATALLCAGCSAAGPEQPQRAEFRQPFSLRVGATAQVGDAGWQVGFDGVANDSRCPKGAQCVWAGEATARLWLRQGTGARLPLQLRASPGMAQAAAVGQGHELRLMQLDPYPVVGQPIANTAYVVTLVLTPTHAAAGSGPSSPER